ncbi:phosphoribosylaminoimidazole synthetase [Arcobacter sp. FWKO B]|uniref:phosphoribosylaminoimidazole synthetase n=1 Tax=Arcobacter sp. FWKO B TaxID=2593672 RepID=UPI0018A55942|nr:phosphoribosylaminoimidazole synthetase [Arcobacter sp. FWKO B]QOG12140.1 phosphoribosylaminoimidazole synthetase [Arcobacter sp. FWKO B]
MCGEKLQRFLMAFVLLVAFYFMSIGSIVGVVLQFFVIGMILVWAITDFCPSIWFFNKFFGKCEKK